METDFLGGWVRFFGGGGTFLSLVVRGGGGTFLLWGVHGGYAQNKLETLVHNTHL